MPIPTTGCSYSAEKEVIGGGRGKDSWGGRPGVCSLNEVELDYYTLLCGPPLGILFGHDQELRKEYSFNKYNHCIEVYPQLNVSSEE